MKAEWCEREFLSNIDKSSTSSIVSFAGEVKNREDSPTIDIYYIEIADCHDKIRLHKTPIETKADWIKKIKKVSKHINNYIKWLEMQ